MALNQPNMSTGRFAIRKIVKSPNGLPITIYIDAQTGERLTDLNGYELINPDNTGGIDINTTAIQDTIKEDDLDGERESVAKKIIDGTLFENTDNGGDVDGLGLANKEESTATNRNPANNFGYRETPRAVRIASALPGGLGMLSKAGRVGYGINNMEAVGKARDSIGLTDNNSEKKNTIASMLGSVVGLSDASRVANVRIGEKDYTVDFDAQDKEGRTTLTPNEARTRGLLNPDGIRELSKEEQATRDEVEYEPENKRQSFFNALFNRDDSDEEITKDSYPERPSLTEAVLSDTGATGETHSHISKVPDKNLPMPSSRPSDGGSGGSGSGGSNNGFSDAVNSAAGQGLF